MYLLPACKWYTLRKVVDDDDDDDNNKHNRRKYALCLSLRTPFYKSDYVRMFSISEWLAVRAISHTCVFGGPLCQGWVFLKSGHSHDSTGLLSAQTAGGLTWDRAGPGRGTELSQL
jgi:hypothetical protein